VQSAKDGDITLSRKNDVVDLKLRNGSATMKTVPNDDFPEFGAVDGETTEFDGQLFSRAARSVMFAASPSMIRPELASVYVSHNQNTLVLVSTDSFRLVEKKMVLEKPVSFDSLMIPAKNMSEILSILPDGHLSLTLSEHNALFSSSGVSVSTRLTSGSYPDYTQILPKEFVSTATVLTKDLMNALKRVTIFSDSFQKITLSIDPKKKEFSISAKNNDLGESKETLDGALTGDTLTIHINHRYFIDVFQALSTDSVRLSFVGEGRPILVEGVGDTSFLYLVMPMNR
jgi:DNA polymerase-3 subunit beta